MYQQGEVGPVAAIRLTLVHSGTRGPLLTSIPMKRQPIEGFKDIAHVQNVHQRINLVPCKPRIFKKQVYICVSCFSCSSVN